MDGVAEGFLQRNLLKAKDGTLPLHPLLFALAPPLAVLANGLDQARFSDALPAMIGGLLFAVLVYASVSGLRRRRDAAGAIIATVWIIGSLFYTNLFHRVNDWVDGGYSMVRTLPIAIAILAVVTVFFLRTRVSLLPVNTILNAIAAVLVATPLWSVLSYEWQNREARSIYEAEDAFAAMPELQASAAAADGAMPDIYHFIFDRYTSEQILSRYFDTDNSAIGRFLEEHGFYVARRSHSNYLKTGHSVASNFHMDYLDFLAGKGLRDNNWHPIFDMLADHRTGRFLKAQGYDMFQYGSWWAGTHQSAIADENHPFGLSEFNMKYLRLTALKPLVHLLPDSRVAMMLGWDNAQCQRVGPQVEAVKALGEREGPTYAFVHILVPHGPYVFAPDGTCLSQAAANARGADEGFLDQIEYANSIIRDLVTTLQEGDGPDPVIIIQADEGPFPERDGSVPWQDVPADELRIKTGILNAFYFPNGDYSELSREISPVNTYRVLFNSYFGTDLPILPDRVMAFPHDWVLYEYHDVTEKVRRGADNEGSSRSIDEGTE